MMRSLVTALALVAAVIGGMTLAHHDQHGKPGVKTLSRIEIAESIEGKKSKATTVEVTLGPGESDAPHRHPGAAFGYVLEGEYEWAIDDNPSKTLKAGETFYEPTRCLHRVSRNPSPKNRTRILAVVLHPADVDKIVLPETNETNK